MEVQLANSSLRNCSFGDGDFSKDAGTGMWFSIVCFDVGCNIDIVSTWV